MLKDLLNNDDEVTITESTIKSVFNSAAEKISETLKAEFSNSTLRLFIIERLNKGISQPIHVISVEYKKKSTKNERITKYFTLRIMEKNEDPNPEYYDRALDQKRRMIKIKKLGQFYPFFKMLETQWFIIFLQEFIFSPIAKFITQEELSELLNLVKKASEEGLLLDYNQNHFLFDKKELKLYYVDKDYVDDGLSHNVAFKDNFNQALVYMEKSNIKFFKNAVKSLNNNYIVQIISILENNLEKFILRKNPTKKAFVVKELHQSLLESIKAEKTS